MDDLHFDIKSKGKYEGEGQIMEVLNFGGEELVMLR